MGALSQADRELLAQLRDVFPGLVERILAATTEASGEAPPPVRRPIAWGAKVSATFRERVWWIADELGFNPDWLMSVMAWETGRSFRPDVRNMAGSGATGLIQFMRPTAINLGTTVDKLAAMTAEDQLNFVYKYLRSWKGKISNLADLYMTVLWPKGVGKPDDYIVFDGRQGSIAYRQNAGFDRNSDKIVTKAEVSAPLYAILAEGLKLAA